MILSSFQLVADKVGNYSPSEECKNAHKTMINPFGTVLGWIQFHDPSKILSDGRGSQTSALEFNLKSHILQMLLQSQGPSFLHSVNSNMQAVQIANICGVGVVVEHMGCSSQGQAQDLVSELEAHSHKTKSSFKGDLHNIFWIQYIQTYANLG